MLVKIMVRVGSEVYGYCYTYYLFFSTNFTTVILLLLYVCNPNFVWNSCIVWLTANLLCYDLFLNKQ